MFLPKSSNFIKYTVLKMKKPIDWSTPGTYQQKLSDPLLQKLIDRLNELTPLIISTDSKKLLTKAVKNVLIDCGHGDNNKYKVYANGFSVEEAQIIAKKTGKFVNREWLYDIHWYIDVPNENYMPQEFILACECEWSKNQTTNWQQNKRDIGYDFQKLLFCNARFRVFICRIHKEIVLPELGNYFDRAIQFFKNLSPGSNFICICYSRESKKMFYREFSKKRTVKIIGNI